MTGTLRPDPGARAALEARCLRVRENVAHPAATELARDDVPALLASNDELARLVATCAAVLGQLEFGADEAADEALTHRLIDLLTTAVGDDAVADAIADARARRDTGDRTAGARPPIRWWPFDQAPEPYRFHDNGGDEDWVVHVPADWVAEPVPPCPDHGRDVAGWGTCRTCDDARGGEPVLHGPPLDLHRIAVCGLRWYVLGNGDHVAITCHA